MVLPIPHCRFPSAALLGLVIALLLATGCQKALPQRNLSLSYDFWYDQMEDRPFDMDSATILERRFHDRQNLLLGRHEYTLQPDGKTYGSEYIADLTWEVLKVESPERESPFWIISHLECDLELNHYLVGMHGKRVPAGSLAYREFRPYTGYSHHGDLENGEYRQQWVFQFDLFLSTSDRPTLYVDLRDSTHESLSQLTEYEDVHFETSSWEILRVNSSSNGLASAWADDVVKTNLVFTVTPSGRVIVYHSEIVTPLPQLRNRKAFVSSQEFQPGRGVVVGETEIIDGNPRSRLQTE